MKEQRCCKPAAQQCPVGRSRFGTERGAEGVSSEVGGGSQEGGLGKKRNGAGVQEKLGGQNLLQRCG